MGRSAKRIFHKMCQEQGELTAKVMAAAAARGQKPTTKFSVFFIAFSVSSSVGHEFRASCHLAFTTHFLLSKQQKKGYHRVLPFLLPSQWMLMTGSFSQICRTLN